MPFLLGKIHYSKLKSVHISLVRQEIEAWTQQVPDVFLGIRALTKIIRTDEKNATGKDLKCFEPEVKPAEEWDTEWIKP